MHALDPELQTATALVFPDVAAPDIDRVDVARLLDLLVRNKTPLAALPPSAALDRLQENKVFVEALANESEQRDLVLAVYSTIARAWQQAGVRGILITSPGYFPYTSDNLDVLVREDARPVAERVLLDMGYVELPHIREPNKRLYRKITEPNFGFPIHVHTRVEWGNIFLTDREIMATYRESPEVPELAYPSSENNILITTAHWLYEDKEVKLRDLYHTAAELRENLDWDYIIENARDKGWAGELRFGLAVYERLARALRGSDPPLADDALAHVRYPAGVESYLADLAKQRLAMPFRLSKLFCKSLAFTKTARDRTLTFGGRMREWAILVRFMFFIRTKRWHRQRRMVVSLSGIDGAGKTTLATRLGDALELFGIRVHYRWMRLGSSTGLELLKAPLKRGRRGGAAKSAPEAKKHLEGRPLLARLWGGVLMADFVVRAWLRWLQSLVRGGVWIYDRYAIDAAVELDAGYHLPNAAVVTKLVPKPELSVLIKVDGAQARARSDDSEPSGYVDATSEIYPRYGDQYDLVLNGNRPLNDLLNDLPHEALKRYLGDK